MQPRKPTSRKPKGAGGTARASLKIVLEVGLAKRLKAFAGWRGVPASDVVAELVADKLRGFKVYQVDGEKRGELLKGGAVDLSAIDEIT